MDVFRLYFYNGLLYTVHKGLVPSCTYHAQNLSNFAFSSKAGNIEYTQWNLMSVQKMSVGNSLVETQAQNAV